MPAFNMVVCAWAIVVEVVPSPQCPSNHVDLKYQINSSASLVLGASDSTKVYSMMGLFCSCMSVHLPSTCLCMTGTYQLYLNIYAAVPGHASNIKGKYMPSVLRVVLYCIYSDYRYL